MSLLTADLLEFLNASPTPYHAVESVKKALHEAGFSRLNEGQPWDIKQAGRYYIERRNASIVAFKMGDAAFAETGFRIIGAHTDSPTLKVKPNPDIKSHSYSQLGVEVYGGVLLSPWFDRDLSIAGRVTYFDGDELRNALINFKRPIAVIPSLAIHLDRTANSGRELNPQTQMKPILMQGDEASSFKQLLIKELASNQIVVDEAAILEYDLSFYDTQPAATVGINNEFIASARLDNLLSCYVGLQAFLDSEDKTGSMLALFDHEEVGSTSAVGANSNMLPALFERLCPSVEERHRALANSVMFSVDNAHGIHPNFASKHDEGHAPKLNSGPVIKVDASQSYATEAETAGLVQWLAKQADVPFQRYVTRADLRCGSTIGPMSAAKTGIKTVDIGVPTFAMHSIRELAGTNDTKHLHAILENYLNTRLRSL